MRIRFEGVTQRYEGLALFSGLDLEIPSGKFFTLLGPSGCGKTTLLRMLAGFVVPDEGRVMFGDTDVTNLPVHKRNVGMVFQDYALFPDRSALANVMYGLAARKMPTLEANSKAMTMLRRVGLADYAGRSPATLSGGQRQRVAMARALVIDPQLLLLDEPLAALDVKLRVELRAMVRELQLESGITTVFVTHDQEEALALSDVIAVMDRGRIVQMGAPREIYASPANEYVADFMGSANVIEAEGGRRKVVRREAIQLGEGDMRGVVEHVEFRGSVTGYRIRTELGVLHVDVWNSDRVWDRGDEVSFRLPPSASTP
jgi:iron(III) transport system ATP-binding protein